ncbi:hypothetical protein GCM10017708_22820 [Arthrobacter citreus]
MFASNQAPAPVAHEEPAHEEAAHDEPVSRAIEAPAKEAVPDQVVPGLIQADNDAAGSVIRDSVSPASIPAEIPVSAPDPASMVPRETLDSVFTLHAAADGAAGPRLSKVVYLTRRSCRRRR